MSDKIVIKRDGAKEPFSKHTIERVVRAAGVEEHAAATLAEAVEVWSHKQSEPTISSLKVRDQVLKELKLINTYAANLFEWYQKTKEKK